MVSVQHYTNKRAKYYHLAQKPVRALGWKASAALASLISHPSLILSLKRVVPGSSAALSSSCTNLDVAFGPREAVNAWMSGPAATTAGLGQESVCGACQGAAASEKEA